MAKLNTGDNPFWQFSVRIYGRPGLASACLALQEEHHVDVNLLLYACWRGRDLKPEELARVDRLIADWRETVVLPIRALRRNLKGIAGVESSRDLLKQAELQAESTQQQMMWELSAQSDSSTDAEGLDQALNLFAGFSGLTADDLDPFRDAAQAAVQGLCS